jgi:hypothetical protein
MGLRIEVGDRVRSIPTYAQVVHEGTVQTIVIEDSVTLLGILIDSVGDKPIKPKTEESPSSLWTRVPPTEGIPNEDFPQLIKPFTPEMVTTYVRFQGEEDPETKYQLLLSLGNSFLQEIDTIDTDLPEWVLEMAQEAINAQSKVDEAEEALEAKILRVGRLVVRNLREITPETSTQVLPKRVLSSLN